MISICGSFWDTMWINMPQANENNQVIPSLLEVTKSASRYYSICIIITIYSFVALAGTGDPIESTESKSLTNVKNAFVDLDNIKGTRELRNILDMVLYEFTTDHNASSPNKDKEPWIRLADTLLHSVYNASSIRYAENFSFYSDEQIWMWLNQNPFTSAESSYQRARFLERLLTTPSGIWHFRTEPMPNPNPGLFCTTKAGPIALIPTGTAILPYRSKSYMPIQDSRKFATDSTRIDYSRPNTPTRIPLAGNLVIDNIFISHNPLEPVGQDGYHTSSIWVKFHEAEYDTAYIIEFDNIRTMRVHFETPQTISHSNVLLARSQMNKSAPHIEQSDIDDSILALRSEQIKDDDSIEEVIAKYKAKDAIDYMDRKIPFIVISTEVSYKYILIFFPPAILFFMLISYSYYLIAKNRNPLSVGELVAARESHEAFPIIYAGYLSPHPIISFVALAIPSIALLLPLKIAINMYLIEHYKPLLPLVINSACMILIIFLDFLILRQSTYYDNIRQTIIHMQHRLLQSRQPLNVVIRLFLAVVLLLALRHFVAPNMHPEWAFRLYVLLGTIFILITLYKLLRLLLLLLRKR